MSETQTLLTLANVNKEFGTGTVDEVKALDNINLDIITGDFITVIGSNGAGKSTLLNIIAGVYPPERGGSVIIDNRDITNLSEHKRARYFGRVYQDPHVGTAAKMTISENLSLAVARGKPRGLRLATNKNRLSQFREILETLKLGLEDRFNTLVGTLSGGQRQALALVMATISRPSLLLLDEHTAKLDPNTAGIVLNLTESIVANENITALMVTHNMEHALRYGNRLLMMHKGKLIVDLDSRQRQGITVIDLLSAFERASGEQLADDSILLNTPTLSDSAEDN
ncbi:MAG: ATP-binding cassette domain-containing protein [Dehalococcoidales bacterium]|nr:MAG: ATP-binding cassette domain-containing protein [Dehalococcoidales bacterium]